MKDKRLDMNKELKKALTPNDRQSHITLHIDRPGSGMSEASIRSCVKIAQDMATKRYGNPNEFREFFDPDKDVISTEQYQKIEAERIKNRYGKGPCEKCSLYPQRNRATICRDCGQKPSSEHIMGMWLD